MKGDIKPLACAVCGTKFVPQYAHQVCCSDECKRTRKLALMRAYRLQRPRPQAKRRDPIQCVICGKEFIPRNSSSITCSKECSAERYRQRNRDNCAKQRAKKDLPDYKRIRQARLAAIDRRNAEVVANTPVSRVTDSGIVTEIRGRSGGGGFANHVWQFFGEYA